MKKLLPNLIKEKPTLAMNSKKVKSRPHWKICLSAGAQALFGRGAVCRTVGILAC
jgi:hypothetical protein